jgi:protein-disulfide isomerase
MRKLFAATAAALALTLAWLVLHPSSAPAADGSEAGASPFSDRDRAALHAEIRAYLLANPHIVREMVALLEAQDAADQAATDRVLLDEHAERLFDDGFSAVRGNPEGSLTVVEFLDYQCGFCRRADPEIAELLASDGDIRLIVKEIPILGPGSELAARAAIASLIAEGPDAYASLGARLMATEGDVTEASLDAALEGAGLDPAAIRAGMADPEVDRRLAETRALAQDLGIQGTPTFVFGDRFVRGYIPLADMEALVAELRTAAPAAE